MAVRRALTVYPVRNNAPPLCNGLGFTIIPAGLNAPLGFLTEFNVLFPLAFAILPRAEARGASLAVGASGRKGISHAK
jgi:hypothetical protein